MMQYQNNMQKKGYYMEFMEILTGKPAEEKEEATAAAPVTAEAEPTI